MSSMPRVLMSSRHELSCLPVTGMKGTCGRVLRMYWIASVVAGCSSWSSVNRVPSTAHVHARQPRSLACNALTERAEENGPSERIMWMSSALGRRLPSLSRRMGEPPGVVAGDSRGVATGVSHGDEGLELRPEMDETAERTRLFDMVKARRRAMVEGCAGY